MIHRKQMMSLNRKHGAFVRVDAYSEKPDGDGLPPRQEEKQHAERPPLQRPLERHLLHNGAQQPVDYGDPPPSERFGHTATLVGGSDLVLFGGSDLKGSFSAETYIFHVETGKWSKITMIPVPGARRPRASTLPKSGVGVHVHIGVAEDASGPSGRAFHSAVTYSGSLYIFGGRSNGNYNDLHRLSFDNGPPKWESVLTVGRKPSPRFGHTAVAYGESMYIFGGYDKDGFACNDLHQFAFETSTWTLVRPEGTVVPRDVYHHSAVLNQGSMYVFGGHNVPHDTLFEYRFGTNTWSIVNTTGKPPQPCWGHSAVVHKNCMYILGGRDSVANSNNLMVFNFDTLAWKNAESSGRSARFFAAAAVHEDVLYVVGGRNLYAFAFNDVHGYSLESSRTPNTMADDLRSLLNDPELSDIVFYFPEEDEEIYCHRNILVARCEPFRAMLHSGMRESQVGGRTEISDIGYRSFYSLVEYLYTGELRVSTGDVLELLHAADKYQLSHLKRLCEKKMKPQVGIDNAVALYLIADKLTAAKLRKYCVQFIRRNIHAVRPSLKTLSAEMLSELTDPATSPLSQSRARNLIHSE